MSVVHGEQVRSLEEHVEVGRSMNWWGMILFISSEALIFANLIAAYLYLEVRGLQIKTVFGSCPRASTWTGHFLQSIPSFCWQVASQQLLRVRVSSKAIGSS